MADLVWTVSDPVVVLTADASGDARTRALALGATDFLTKPFDAIELRLRVAHLLSLRALHREALGQHEVLEARVAERSRDVKAAHWETLHRLALAADHRIVASGKEIHWVGALAARVGAAIGLPLDQVEMLRLAAPLHDVGKIALPDVVLLKPGPLTPDEWNLVRTHAERGAQLLAGSELPMLQMAERIARFHHERWDGTGYPHGLVGPAIPLEGRITALADVVEAVTHDRPFQPAWPLERAVALVRQQRGRHFDPDLVDAVLDVGIT